MESRPLISVIMPVYRVEGYIQSTLKSLAEQSYKGFEIVIIDDGSPDKSIRVAEEFLASTQMNYRIIVQENSGQGFARNTGFYESIGEWVYFLDADDVIQPFTFEGFKGIAETHPNAEMVFTDYQIVKQENLLCRALYSDEHYEIAREEMLEGFLTRSITPLVPGTFFKKQYLTENNIIHSNIRWSEDQQFMWKVLSRAKIVVKWECITYNYHKHDGSTMTSTPASSIVAAYQSFLELPALFSERLIRRYLVPRWVLGSIHSFSRYSSYGEWKNLFDALNGKKHLKVLRSFPSPKIRVLAYIGALSSRLIYAIMRGK